MAPKDTSKPRLVIIEGKDKGKVIPIEAGTTVVGRTKGDVILQDPRVSRSHVALNYDERSGKLSYADLKSLNGTLVNGNTVESGVLVDGDRLQIGNTLFDCQLSDATELAEIKAVAPPKKTAEKPKARPAPLAELNEISVSSPSLRREPEFEPTLQPFDDHESAAPTRLMDDEDEPAPSKRAPRASAPAFLQLYRKVRPLYRNLFLVLFTLGGVLSFFDAGRPSADFLREVSSVKQLQKEGKVSEALQKAETLSQAYDGDPEIFITLGGLYALQKRFEPAIAAYRRAKTINPDHPVATVRLIGLYLRANLDKEADLQMQDLDNMMKDKKFSRELFVEAANLFLEFPKLTQSPQKALILSKALQKEFAVDSTIGYKLEAQLHFQQQQNQEALNIIERGLQLDPQDEWLLENHAFAKLALKDPIGAATVVENWIRVHPTATKALLVMAYLKFNEKNYLAALPYLQKIAQLGTANPNDPHLPEAYNLMGQIYWNQGQTAEAKSLFTQACEGGFTAACNHDSLRAPQSTSKQEAAEPEAETKSEP